MNVHPFQVLWQLDALVVGKVNRLVYQAVKSRSEGGQSLSLLELQVYLVRTFGHGVLLLQLVTLVVVVSQNCLKLVVVLCLEVLPVSSVVLVFFVGLALVVLLA